MLSILFNTKTRADVLLFCCSVVLLFREENRREEGLLVSRKEPLKKKNCLFQEPLFFCFLSGSFLQRSERFFRNEPCCFLSGSCGVVLLFRGVLLFRNEPCFFEEFREQNRKEQKRTEENRRDRKRCCFLSGSSETNHASLKNSQKTR